MRAEIEQLQHRGVFAAGDEPALRWGMLGTGGIAETFAATVHANTRQRIVAVGSRTPARAEDFATRHGIERAHGSYSAVIADEVDVVYIALTADAHCERALEAIAAGRHVLVEKPFAMNGDEAARMAQAARSTGVVAMEAMWTRYLPQSDAIRLLVADGTLGDIKLVFADHGQAITADPAHRLHHAELGGGALLDLGIYPIAFASQLLGPPDDVATFGEMLPSGVDGSAELVLTCGGARALLSTTMVVRTPTTAAVAGTEARLELRAPFFTPTGFALGTGDFGEPMERWEDQTGITMHRGLCYQATALARFAAEGRTESPVHTLDETVSIMRTIDAALAALS
jgi:predicted dehydrogenase